VIGRRGHDWFGQNFVLLRLWFIAIVIVLAKNTKTGPQSAIVNRLFR
jgi:hypothetical protein